MAINIGNVINYGMDAIDIGSTFVDNRKQGKGLVASLGSAAVKQAGWMYAAPLMWTNMALSVGGAAKQAIQAYGSGAGKVYAGRQEAQYSHGFGGNYIDTKANATMRQRGMRAIEQSGQNLNSVFGGEARTYFRGVY